MLAAGKMKLQHRKTRHSTTAQNRTKSEMEKEKEKNGEKTHNFEMMMMMTMTMSMGQHDNVVMGHGWCYSLSKSSLAYLFRLCQKINKMMRKDI